LGGGGSLTATTFIAGSPLPLPILKLIDAPVFSAANPQRLGKFQILVPIPAINGAGGDLVAFSD